MTTRANEDFQRPNGCARPARFVLVNERIPRANAHCAACCAPIERGYVRDPQTRLAYCDPHCFVEHEKMSMPATSGHARRVS
jgi:hypothetical protein